MECAKHNKQYPVSFSEDSSCNEMHGSFANTMEIPTYVQWEREVPIYTINIYRGIHLKGNGKAWLLMTMNGTLCQEVLGSCAGYISMNTFIGKSRLHYFLKVTLEMVDPIFAALCKLSTSMIYADLSTHEPQWASNQIRESVGCACAGNVFPPLTAKGTAS